MMTTPETDQYWLLNHVAGWREASRQGLSFTDPEGYLRLDPLPGTATLLLDAERQAQHFVCPSALAPDGCGRLLVVDATTHRVKQIDLGSGRIETLPAIGGEGSAPRQLYQPRGVAILPSRSTVVADTANHRIQIFSPPPYALLQVWGATDALRHPTPGQGRKEFRWPWAVATDVAGTVYVVDRGNHRIQKIRHDGTWLGEVGGDVLNDPIALAIGPDGRLAVVDVGREQQAVVVFPPDHAPFCLHGGTRQPRSVAFDTAGNLYVGDAIGLVHVLALNPQDPGEYRLVGAGVSGLDGVVVQLAWERSSGLLAIIRERYDGQRQRLWRLDPAGASALIGRFITTALDSNIERCQWHRVLLNATVPERTSLQIESFTSDKPVNVVALPDSSVDWQPCMLTGDDDPDCLIQSGPGQYLWLRLTLRSGGRASPELRWMKVFFPRASYLQYLPAVYQEDDDSRHFLERFLSIFQTEFDALDRRIDQLWQLFDPDSVPRQHLEWLAGWLALIINPEWTEAKMRQMLKDAFLAFGRRGTVAGLERVIQDYACVQAKILEHFRLRRWPALAVAAPLDGSVRLWSRDFYQRLQLTSYSQVGYFRLTGHPEPALEPFDWGAHKFTVFFPADPYRVEATEQRVARIVEREKPAHTEATLCPVLPRFRVGVQATVGVDSMVGGVNHLVLCRLSTLNYDSILTCSAPEHHLRALGSAVRPRLGVTTILP